MRPVQGHGFGAQVSDRPRYKLKKPQQAQQAGGDLDSFSASRANNKMDPTFRPPQSVDTRQFTSMPPPRFHDAREAKILKGADRTPHVPLQLPTQSLPQPSSNPLSQTPPPISFAVPSSHTFSPEIAIPPQKLHFAMPKFKTQPIVDTTRLAARPEKQANERLQNDMSLKSKYFAAAGDTAFKSPITETPWIRIPSEPNVAKGIERNSDNYEQMVKYMTSLTGKHVSTPPSVLSEFFKRDDIRLPRLSPSNVNGTNTTASQTTPESKPPNGYLRNQTRTHSPETKPHNHPSSQDETLADSDSDSSLDIFFDALESQPTPPLYQRATINEIISDICLLSFSGSLAKPNPKKNGLLYSLVTRTPQIKPRISLSNIVDLPDETFWLFPWFPTEIRIKIWKASLPGPRFVQVLETKDNRFVCTPIEALYICRESRHEAFKIYEFAFAVGNAPPLIPFNFEMDALFISPSIIGRADYFRRNCSAGDLARVRRLAVQNVEDSGHQTWTYGDFMTRSLSSRELIFPSLIEFFIISEFQDDSKSCENCRLGNHNRACLERDNVMGCRIGNFISRIHNQHIRFLIERGPVFRGGGEGWGLGVTIVYQSVCEEGRYDLPWYSQNDAVVREWRIPTVIQLHSSGVDYHRVFLYGVMDDLRRAVFR